ncbi:hypothetical protein JOF41_004823 [Saccharothrix coeruleofusca]|uniref:hypothetical protein n=1 Tax=Saccharothrix coeruleofusca TaxID=33919 RepID=UPI001AE1A931|nr:hypothetical protein [Saccharothrix coeruleofusca]MBP2338645.1 hypothetical protein [Saccharothrix coeruleofusca]
MNPSKTRTDPELVEEIEEIAAKVEESPLALFAGDGGVETNGGPYQTHGEPTDPTGGPYQPHEPDPKAPATPMQPMGGPYQTHSDDPAVARN